MDTAISEDLTEERLAVMAMRPCPATLCGQGGLRGDLAVIRAKHPQEDPKAKKEREKEEAKRAKAQRKAAEKETQEA